MKGIAIILMVLMPFFSRSQSKYTEPFTINGIVTNYEAGIDGIIYLKYEQNGKTIVDSCKINQGKYHFDGQLSYPVLAVVELKVPDSVTKFHLRTRFIKKYAHQFYLDKSNMYISSDGEMQASIVKGSQADLDRQELEAKVAPYWIQNNEIRNSRSIDKQKDSLAILEDRKKSYAIYDQIQKTKNEYMFSHPESGMVLDRLYEYTRSSLDPIEIAPFFEKIRADLKDSERGKKFALRIDKNKLSQRGTVAPDFILKNRHGKEVSLSSLKGKLVLLDFWGSWCMPCRSTHPHLRKLYDQYKDQGFEIFGVASENGSAEAQYNKWTKAIDEDNMSWINVLAVETKNNVESVLSLYNISAFPTKILIDKDGKIIKKIVGSGAKADEFDTLIANYFKGN